MYYYLFYLESSMFGALIRGIPWLVYWQAWLGTGLIWVVTYNSRGGDLK